MGTGVLLYFTLWFCRFSYMCFAMLLDCIHWFSASLSMRTCAHLFFILWICQCLSASDMCIAKLLNCVIDLCSRFFVLARGHISVVNAWFSIARLSSVVDEAGDV